MAATPNFTAIPNLGLAVISTANTNRDGTGTIATVLTAGSSGSRIDRIRIIAIGATTAGMIRLFIHDGTNARLYREIPVGALSPSGTVQAFNAEINFAGDNALTLPSGFSLRASTHLAESFVVVAEGGNF